MIIKTPYEDFFWYHDFTDWLNEDEIITTVVITVYAKGEEVFSVIGDAFPYNQKKARYRVFGEVLGEYDVSIQIETSNNQKFEDFEKIVIIKKR